MNGKKVNIKPLFEACGMDVGDLEIIETSGMYPYKEIIEENWAYFTASGCKRLKELFEREQRGISGVGVVGRSVAVWKALLSRIFLAKD